MGIEWKLWRPRNYNWRIKCRTECYYLYEILRIFLYEMRKLGLISFLLERVRRYIPFSANNDCRGISKNWVSGKLLVCARKTRELCMRNTSAFHLALSDVFLGCLSNDLHTTFFELIPPITRSIIFWNNSTEYFDVWYIKTTQKFLKTLTKYEYQTD